MSWRLFLLDDSVARAWTPLALTMPAGEILFGATLLRERLERFAGLAAEGYIAGAGLEAFTLRGAPPVVEPSAVPTDRGLVVLSTRYVPPLPGKRARALELPTKLGESPIRLTVGGSQVGWILPPRSNLESTISGELEAAGPSGTEGSSPGPSEGADRSAVSSHAGEHELSLPGYVVESLWDLVERNGEQLTQDLLELYPGSSETPTIPDFSGVECLGELPVSVGEGVAVDPGVVLDTRSGPIRLESGVQVRPFTHLKGPALIGHGSTLLGGVLDTLSCGPTCNLRGEISHSIVLGYANKAHDGYLGHSLLGRWVNLGAMTTNSDLKNNYGPVRVATPGGQIDTGRLKVGVFFGDHVKTAIGTMLSAGTMVGAGTNLFGDGPPPKYVPPFHWGGRQGFVPHELGAFLDTAERVMARRGVEMLEGERELLRRAWHSVHRRGPGDSE